MADTLSTLAVVAFILAGVFFVTAFVLFIVLRIPKVIDYFTNRSAKRSVKRMVASGDSSSKIASFQTSLGNKVRGKLTEHFDVTPPPKTNPASSQPTATAQDLPETGLLSEKNHQTAYLDTTEKLVANLAPETDILDEQATSLLAETIDKVGENRPRIEITKLDEVILVHTNEVVR